MLKIPAVGAAPVVIKDRPLDMLSTDTAAVRAIAQAAVSVELFTIPLYMCTMYSIQGTHQINSKGAQYYKGRQWPGMATSADPRSANEKAFNVIFSVFIQEMLHLQMASNLATAIGVTPSFTGPELQTTEHGWKCYGPQLSTIPHIVDLKDTQDYQDVRVNLEALNPNQCKLFLAIEQPEEQAREQLRGVADEDKYFPQVPLAGWTPDKTVRDLPLFGTIGYMYECYARYINIEYTDGQTLWQKLFVANSVQQDLFNTSVPGQIKPEFPRFDTCFRIDDQDPASVTTFDKAIAMMAAITDQGEGNAAGIMRYRRTRMLKAVQPDYREDDAALKQKYPSYGGDGCPVHSRDAVARFDSAAYDHYERFQGIEQILGEVRTWEQWHAEGNVWSGSMLVNAEYDRLGASINIPRPDEVAGALNRLKDDGSNYNLLSKVANGAIYGIVSVLDDFWGDQHTKFPYPSMTGAGDRMSICWAVFGRAADLSGGVPPPGRGVLQHACQGMDLDARDAGHAGCAALAIYHSCKGSNGCHAQGGCGFVQSDSGGGMCGAPAAGAQGHPRGNLCGSPSPTPAPTRFSAPSDNKCRTFGGCAVPISASQLFPSTGTMKLYNFGPAPKHGALPLPDELGFEFSENVYDKAWEAYAIVMKARGQDAGQRPAPTDLRMALPPST